MWLLIVFEHRQKQVIYILPRASPPFSTVASAHLFLTKVNKSLLPNYLTTNPNTMAEPELDPEQQPSTTQSSPSPSPPPTAPVALAPGHRASNFIALYNHALDKTLHSMSYENFAACFPTIAEKAGDTLRGAHRSVIETLGRSARVCLSISCCMTSGCCFFWSRYGGWEGRGGRRVKEVCVKDMTNRGCRMNSTKSSPTTP